jgi:hypothetical protein
LLRLAGPQADMVLRQALRASGAPPTMLDVPDSDARAVYGVDLSPAAATGGPTTQPKSRPWSPDIGADDPRRRRACATKAHVLVVRLSGPVAQPDRTAIS